MSEKVTLKIERRAWEKIASFTDLATGEISGLGKIEMREGSMVVTDVAIFDQEVSGAHSNIETAALAKFQDDRVRAGESMKQWYFWWHSHAHMAVFFSGTDTGTISTSTEFPYLVSLVTNKKHEVKARLDLFHPVKLMCDLEVEIMPEVLSPEVTRLQKLIDEATEAIIKPIKELCQTEIDLKVKRPVFQALPYRAGYGAQADKKPWEGYTRRSWNPVTKDFDEEMVLDAEEKMEYFTHRKYLKDQVEYLRGHAMTRKQQKKLKAMEQQLEEHVQWGKDNKVEPTADSMDEVPAGTWGRGSDNW